MLRIVLADYLDRVGERAFDLPLLQLLPLLGFHDYHFTHGPVELGKDIIAKRRDGGVLTQYVFQSKAGNITPTLWERKIRPQVETAVWNELSHPRFDASLPRHVVLVTTGEIRNTATIQTQDFKTVIEARHPHVKVDFWDKRDLIEMLLEHGLEGVYRATAAGAIAYDRFLIISAHAMRGEITASEVELHSRQWGELDVDRNHRLLISALEAEVLARLCIDRGLMYEVVQIRLVQLRLLCELAYRDDCSGLRELWDREVEALHGLCASHIAQVRETWNRDRDLAKTQLDDLTITTYPVQCLRIMEFASLAYFTATSDKEREHFPTFLVDFVGAEPGCAHLIGDRYAVSLVLAMLALLDSHHLAAAVTLLEGATVWLCDRYAEGFGIAGVEADETTETNLLLGYPFEIIPAPRRRESFLATALMDLAAFIGHADLYADIVNDIKACGIIAEYWQPQDTVGACRYEGEDVLHYPHVDFVHVLDPARTNYADHVTDEPASFHFAQCLGETSTLFVAALLRDRYFPKLWPLLTPNQMADTG